MRKQKLVGEAIKCAHCWQAVKLGFEPVSDDKMYLLKSCTKALSNTSYYFIHWRNYYPGNPCFRKDQGKEQPFH